MSGFFMYKVNFKIMNKSKSHSKKTSIPNTLRIVDGDTIHIGKKNILY